MSEKTCKVPTPPEMVVRMLDKVGYVRNLFGKKVLENSCGEGNFLREIVRRYILDARRNRISEEQIREGLGRDIHGIEIEEDLVEECLAGLDETAAGYGITGVQWHIRQEDALRQEILPIYQYVVGNPPYITYYNLEEEERNRIRENYITCAEGKADYYYAFTEMALRSLDKDGKMVYLIPNNFLKNRFSDRLRRYILPYLVEIEDYTTRKIFNEYLTSSAVIYCEKQVRSNTFAYCDIENGKKITVEKNGLNGKWVFIETKRNLRDPGRLGDFFQISAPIATLLNEAFLLRDARERADGNFEADGITIEKEVLRPAASPKSRQRGQEPYIIFPYWYDMNGVVRRYGQTEFEQRFPGACRYLGKFESKLMKRKSEPNCKWFEYGRSQALAHINQPKLLLSTLITDHVNCYRLDSECVPYSGIYAVPKAGYTLDRAEAVLKSDEFFSYVKAVGINASGNSYRVSPRDICDFPVEKGMV